MQILQVDYDSSVEYAVIVNTIILRSLYYENSESSNGRTDAGL